jgi:Tfp pilus assembly protein PilV
VTKAQGDHRDATAVRAHRDRGNSFIEVLVSLVLMGTTVIGVLVAIRATTTATLIDNDHAAAMTWLQAAADEIYNAPRVACYSGVTPTASATAARVSYDTAAQSATRPTSWLSGTIEVTDVAFIGRASSADPYSWSPSFCLESSPGSCPSPGLYCNSPQTAQRVTIRVTSPTGLVKTLDTVKGA